MRYGFSLLTASVITLVAPRLAWGEAKVAWERNVGAAATPQFKFKEVPSPSKTNAAVTAKVAIVAGKRDANGAGPGGPLRRAAAGDGR